MIDLSQHVYERPQTSRHLVLPSRTRARGASHAPHNRIKIVDGAHPDLQIDPIFRHISYEVRKNKIDLKAGIERQQLGYEWKDL
ncbi:hypothetical protein AYM40_32895 [Paraburkholderia phytofirmans OLGA172]|uniref:Uncharacterized protein n=1 Tax=Paraburkholderia phytofirmans OLGA172 TaxID=1417228 RepID=A0A160FUJ9_9BURK|nr:hypothetical protein AYM40_32895 [Paraburkholderia phytofirmans OLGA172]